VPELGGWVAGALTDSRVVFISVSGGDSSRELAQEMLRMVLRRLEQ
jgi:NAD(P)H-dependent FMN reductase